ncbi:uncharacterized protein UTRI_10416_B [Ustilago trichophora]|uniref:SGNH hydrolase-type esterase domain-containing protein n=1 Tax=Ustilago trichophora TaxID=86804 RepID=A0A5C3EBF4_9BASI|nr:uncharacterized protein UTRI_10416_B [Ustilago trichophora]
MRLISLGSSFAAGPGIAPQIDKDAGRSSNNYPNYFARKLNLDPNDPSQFLDLTVSGATLLNVISEPQDTGKRVFAPQIDLLPTLPAGNDGSDVVITITGGGNDMFYIGSMFAYTLQHTLWGRILSYFLQTSEEKHRLEHPSIATSDEISSRFTTLLDKILAKYPNATIYLVEYFAMMGPNTVPGKHVAWNQQQIQSYIETADLLQSLYAKAAQARDRVHIVPLAEESKQKHALGSKNPWVSDGSLWNFYKGGAFHPNQIGMKAAAEILFDFHTKLNPSKALQ